MKQLPSMRENISSYYIKLRFTLCELIIIVEVHQREQELTTVVETHTRNTRAYCDPSTHLWCHSVTPLVSLLLHVLEFYEIRCFFEKQGAI